MKADRKRLRDKILERSIPEPNTGCLLWIGKLGNDGYGVLKIGRQPTRAHRASFQAFLGGLDNNIICHKCHTPACVNPEHLKLGTHADNAADRRMKFIQFYGSRKGAKLNEGDIIFIRASEKTNVALAKQFGVSATTISKVKRGLKWKDVK